MKKTLILLIGILAGIGATGTATMYWPIITTEYVYVRQEAKVEPVDQLTHEQRVWLGVLEWCESRGNNKAINPRDRDGTPSYGGFQFKPSTLAYYATMYDVPLKSWHKCDAEGSANCLDDNELMSYPIQKSVVEKMIEHRDDIDWGQQFPDCTKRFGYPPSKH